MSRRARPRVLLVGIAMLLLGASACGGRAGGEATGVEVDGAWARTTPPEAVDGAAYLTVTVPADDRLVAATVPGSVATAAVLHATTGGDANGGGDGHHGGGGASGAVTMAEVGGVDLRAGEAYAFAPGGSHVMLVGLRGPLVTGTRFPMVLEFTRGAPYTVRVTVRVNPPRG
ncbi:MAG: copper chaperone PCu(A)C [Actinobacteria bacterium]|nr:copper chaperone PCu(A)C [Actinomycetota bacterium]